MKQRNYPSLPASLFRLLFYGTLFLILACSENKSPDPGKKGNIFSLPHVYQYDRNSQKPASFFKSDAIIDASTFFIDKFSFTDTVKIDNVGERDLEFGNDFITGDSAGLRRLRDSFSSDGLQVIPDYKMSIPINWRSLSKNGYYYPIFVVNETNSDKLFTARDRYVSAIQEAKTKDGKWRPIESKKFDFLGNGRWALLLHPHEFALFITAKYEGSYKTLIRIRMKVGDVTYLSKAFEGSINEKQFLFNPDSYQYKEYEKDKSSSISRRFLGSLPEDPM